MKRHDERCAVHISPEVSQRLRAAADEKGVKITWLADRLLAEALDAMVPGPLVLTKREGE